MYAVVGCLGEGVENIDFLDIIGSDLSMVVRSDILLYCFSRESFEDTSGSMPKNLNSSVRLDMGGGFFLTSEDEIRVEPNARGT
jgi:hypothetical protein